MIGKPKDMLALPKMIGSLLYQLVYYTCTEVETFLLTVISVLYGYHYGWVWGVTIFFTIYFVMRMVGGYMSMLATALRNHE